MLSRGLESVNVEAVTINMTKHYGLKKRCLEI